VQLLIVGGTGFLGRYLSEQALARGHALTLFNRGLTAPELFPGAEHLRGDRRAGDTEALAGRRFDAAIDTCGYLPREVEALTAVLSATLRQYAFVSSLSVYPDPAASGIDESAPVATLAGPVHDQPRDGSYGALKALCERAVEARMPGRALVVRPGLIAGPRDPTDRFTYWPRRVAEGGRVLGARAEQPVQFIDVRDLATWILDSVEAGRGGTYNVTGPATRLTMAGVFEACREASGSDAEPVWAGDRLLRANGVEPWSELPLWLTASYEGFFEVDCSKAISERLRFRPLAETISDTLDWDASRPPGDRVEHFPRAKEQRLLA
jgi:nucleoside-diphosphate-sugar epimerase